MTLNSSLNTTIKLKITNSTNSNPFFNVTLIITSYNPQRIEWINLIKEELPTIGIGVNFLEILDIETFYERLNNKTYDEGGFDIYSVGSVSTPFLWHPGDVSGAVKDWYLQSLHDLTYSEEMRELWDNYHSEFDEEKRLEITKKAQDLLYEYADDLPILYDGTIWAFNESWDLSKDDLKAIQLTTMRSGWANFAFDDIDPIIVGIPEPLYISSNNIAPNSENPFFEKGEFCDLIDFPSLIWQGLYERNHSNNFKWTPLLAESMPFWSNNNRTATIKLKDNVFFADGHPLTSIDVVESYRMRMTPKFINGDDWAINSYNLLTHFFATNESISSIGNLTVQFNLTTPYPFALNLFHFGIFPAHIWGNHTHPTIEDYKFDTQILEDINRDRMSNFSIGTGPYTYANFSADIVKLQAADTYWNGNVKTQAIHFKNYHVGHFDSIKDLDENQAIADLQAGRTHLLYKIILRNITKAQEAEGIKYHHLISTGVQTTCFNMYHPILGTGTATPLGTADAAKFIRQAVNHIIPRKKIINEVCLGVGFPGVTYVNPYSEMIGWEGLLEPYEYNITKAKELMEKAGYEYPPSDTSSTTTSSSMPTNESITTPSFEILIAFISISTLRLLMIIKRHKHRTQNFPN